MSTSAELRHCAGAVVAAGSSCEQLSFEQLSSAYSSSRSSCLTTPTDSPHGTVDFRKRYRQDELWAAIRSDYQYLMGDDIIETCKVRIST